MDTRTMFPRIVNIVLVMQDYLMDGVEPLVERAMLDAAIEEERAFWSTVAEPIWAFARDKAIHAADETAAGRKSLSHIRGS